MSNKTIIQQILDAPPHTRSGLLRENIEHLKINDLNLISESILNDINSSIDNLQEGSSYKPSDAAGSDEAEQEDLDHVSSEIMSEDDDGTQGVDYLSIATRISENTSPKNSTQTNSIEDKVAHEETQQTIVMDKEVDNTLEAAPEVVETPRTLIQDEQTPQTKEIGPLVLEPDNRVMSKDKVSQKPKKALVATKKSKADLLKDAAPLTAADTKPVKNTGKPKSSLYLAILKELRLLILLMSFSGPLFASFINFNLTNLEVNISTLELKLVTVFIGIQVSILFLVINSFFSSKKPYITIAILTAVFLALATIDNAMITVGSYF